MITFTVMSGITYCQLLQLHKIHAAYKSCYVRENRQLSPLVSGALAAASRHISQDELFFSVSVQELLHDWSEMLSGRGHPKHRRNWQYDLLGGSFR